LTFSTHYGIIWTVPDKEYPERAIRWRLLPVFSGMQILFAFPRGEVMLMFVTWELLFLFAGFLIALLTYIDNHNKKN